MRSSDLQEVALCSYLSPEQRVPADHPVEVSTREAHAPSVGRVMSIAEAIKGRCARTMAALETPTAMTRATDGDGQAK
jgi:hypothetical protein